MRLAAIAFFLMFQARADILPQLEAGGLVYIPQDSSVLISSDETGPNGSPIWRYDFKNQPVNLRAQGLEKIDDVESFTYAEGNYYAMASLTAKKFAGAKKKRRDLVVRFTIEDDVILADRAMDLQHPLLAKLKQLPELADLAQDMKAFEIESLAISDGDAYMGLKGPRWPDGTSIIVKVPGFLAMMESGSFEGLTVSIFSQLNLVVEGCEHSALISDLVKIDAGFLIVGNCHADVNQGEIFLLPKGSRSSSDLKPLLKLTGGKPEAVILTDKSGEAIVGFDNGRDAGSEIRRVNLGL